MSLRRWGARSSAEHREQLAGDLGARQLRERRDRELLDAIEARVVIARDLRPARRRSRSARSDSTATSRRRRTSRRAPARVVPRLLRARTAPVFGSIATISPVVETPTIAVTGVIARDELDARVAVRPAQLALEIEAEQVAEVVDRVAVSGELQRTALGRLRRPQHARAIGRGVAGLDRIVDVAAVRGALELRRDLDLAVGRGLVALARGAAVIEAEHALLRSEVRDLARHAQRSRSARRRRATASGVRRSCRRRSTATDSGTAT